MKWLSICLMFLCSAVLAKPSVEFAGDIWMPVQGVKSPGAKPTGYVLDIVRSIAKRQDREIIYSVLPWKRAIREVSLGHIDCLVGNFQDEAFDNVYPKTHVGYVVNAVYTLAGSEFKMNKPKDLLTLDRIGVPFAYDFDFGEVDRLLKMNQGKVIPFRGVSPLESMIDFLYSDKVDAIIDSELAFYFTLNTLGYDKSNFKKAGEVSRVPMWVSCSSNSDTGKAFLKDFDSSFAIMRSSGELDKILEKYGLQDWQ